MHLKLISRILPLLILLLILSGCVSLAEDITPPPGYQPPTAPQDTATPATPVYPMLPPDPVRGQPLFVEKCAPCHGVTGLGDGPGASELPNPAAPLGDSNFARQSVPADWYLMVSNGNLQKFMPPFNSLTVPERWDVIAYAYTLSNTPEDIALGQSLYVENCAVCHGESGQGDGPEAGSLSASPVDFTNQEFMGTRSAADLFTSITNGLGEMHAYESLSEDERWALTGYLRSLTFAGAPSSDGETQAEPAPESEPAEDLELTPTAAENVDETLAEPAVESGFGTVRVEIVSASGNPLPSDLEVSLFTYQDMTQVYSDTVDASADGVAVAENVPMLPEQVMFATIDDQGVLYGSDIAVVAPEMLSATLTIPYYEQTTDLSILKAERLHIFFEFIGEETMQVYVLYIFSNTSDKVLTTENADEPVLVFNLPSGATNLQRDTGMDIQDVDLPNGFGLLTVYPSAEQYQLLYSFEMPYEKNKSDFNLPVGLDSSAVIVMVPEVGIELKSEQLMDAGMRDIEGISYNMYNGSNLRAGDSLSMQVSGKPKMPATAGETPADEDTSTELVAGLAVFGVMLVGAGVYLWLRNRAADESWDDIGDEHAAGLPDSEDPEDLMDAIITLDELYETGEIPEDAYLKRRAEMKEKLRELVD